MAAEKTVVIILSPYISHIISSLRLMRLLKDRGYRIIYVNEQFLQKAIERYGFNFHCSGMPKTARAKLDVKGLKKLMTTLVTMYNPEIFFAEVGFWDTALLLIAMNRKVLMIQSWACGDRTQFTLRKPLYSLSNNRGLRNFLKFEIHWAKINLRNWFSRALGTEGHSAYYKEIVKISGLEDRHYLSLYNRISYPRVLDSWELILYPSELDFPRERLKNVRFIGSFVDTDRIESDFNWSVFPDDREIVVCSLGSLSHWYEKEKRQDFYHMVFNAFANLANYNLIISVGDVYDEMCTLSLSDNIFIYKSIPQLSVLRRAKFFITHGGAGSIREALRFGVPMIVYPWSEDSDMFGNASRIRYHSLGIVGDIQRDTSRDLVTHIRKMEAGTFNEGVARMQAIFLEDEANENLEVDFIVDIAKN